jgi:AraC family transcriptional regulator
MRTITPGLSGSCYFIAMEISSLSRVPPWFRHAVSARGEWNSFALERSCFGPIHDLTPAVPFHHIAVRLDHAPMQMGWKANGRNSSTDLPQDHVSVIPTGDSMLSWWSRPVDFACLYFTAEAVDSAVGQELAVTSKWELKPALAVRAPTISSLIRAMAHDTHTGHRYGKMRGETLFQQLAVLLVADGRILRDSSYKSGVGDRRVRRALEYIHANVCEELSLERIALAAETSPFHLSRIFRQITGQPIWCYVSRLRVELAVGLMRDRALLLTEIAVLAGFASYSTFAATFQAEKGVSPSQFRRFAETRPG